MDAFRHTATDNGDHVLLTLAGDVDLAAHPTLAAQLSTLVRVDQDIVVDCSGITFLDSMGLRALVEGRHQALAAGLSFTLVDPSSPVLRVLELSGMTDLFKVGDAVPGEPES